MKLFTKARDKKLNTNRRLGGNFSCRHPKLWEYIKSNVKAFFITGAITFVVTVSATTVKILHSRQVRYKNDKSVEQAINELYQKAEQCKRQEMTKIGCDGCTKLEYLESTGTQYIDTLVLSKSTLKVILDASIKSIIRGRGNAIFGAFNRDGGSFGYQINGYTNMLRCDFDKIYGSSYTSYKVTENTRHLWKKDKNVNYVDNTIIYTNGSSKFQTQLSMYLFGKNNTTSDFDLSKLKVFNCKIYDSDILVRNFIPVLDKDGVPCLFDKVSKTCFYNQGTGEFLYG